MTDAEPVADLRHRLKRSFVVAIGLVVAAPAAAQTENPYPNLSEPRYEVTTDFEVKVPMRDGVRLAANVVRPKGAGKFPVVISYYPYGKDPDLYFAARGYVTVFAELRGTGTSEGVMTDYFNAQSYRDGYDLVEWAARQSWSTGKVGMWGISYGAINATRVAALKPPHLKAISVNSSYANFYGDHWYPGGVRSNHPYVWHGAPNVLATMLRGPVYDDGKGGKYVDLSIWKRHQADNGWREFFQPQWDHPTYDAYWQEKDLRSKYADFAVPTLQFGNYFDHARNHDEAYQNYQILKAKKVPQKLVVGPWTHGGFGPNHVVDFQLTTLAWFDYFLRGVDNGITREPPVTLFVMRENRWRSEDDWPIARTIPTPFYLNGGGGLDRTAPTADPVLTPRRFTYHPWVGSAAGPYGTWFNAEYTDYLVQPDQRVDEAESLTFTTEVLGEDTEVTGMADITFFATSSAPNTDFTIKLSDVLPDGKSELVTRGWINSSFRESNVNPRRPDDWKFVAPTPILAGKPYRYQVTLQNISYQFKRGHRIRATIASSDWPSNWPNPNPARNEIRFESPDGNETSHLTLPIVPRRETPLPEPRLALLPTPSPAPADPRERIWIENDLTGKSVVYRAEGRSESPIPGGTLREVNEWRIDLTKEPPYEQVIDLVTTRTLLRAGQPDVRFVYRVKTDGNGPRVTVDWSEGKVP